ncbi:MAG: AAA family ATPase [Verrucomicrobiota bacterium]
MAGARKVKKKEEVLDSEGVPLVEPGDATSASGTEKPSKPTLPEIVGWKDLDARKISKPPVLIEGLVHKGEKVTLTGGSKACKSWSGLDLALSVATGGDFWGRQAQETEVLFCNFELQEYWVRQRIRKICEAKGIDSCPKLDVWNLRGFSADFTQLIPMIIERVKERDYGLICLDPAYKLMSGRDECATKDIGDFVNALEKLAVQTSAAVFLTHHHTKGNQAQKEAIDRFSGSGIFARDPDVLIDMTQHEQPDCYVVSLTLRNLPPTEPWVVEWQAPLMVRTDFNPEDVKRAANQKPKKQPAEIIDLLPAEGGLKAGKWLKVVAEETGMSKATFYRLLGEAKTSGLVIQDANTGEYERSK